jgi:hypothetical protein
VSLPERPVVSRESAIARHLLSHPDDTTYRLARHLRLPFSTARDARKRVESQAGGNLLAFLRRHPVRHRELFIAHPDPARWLGGPPPAPFSISGEDAAAIEGYDLVPHRHVFYVAEEDLNQLHGSLRETGGEPVGPDEANVILRVRDAYLIDDPAPLVEKGQRLVDYLESKNPHLIGRLQLGP